MQLESFSNRHFCAIIGNIGGVAQRLEQRAHNLLVAGSIPAAPTRFLHFQNMIMKIKIDKLSIKRIIYRLQHNFLTINNIVIFVAILISLGWAWGSIESMQQNYELQRSVDQKKQQVEIEKLKVALLEYEAKYYESNEYQEMAVRQRFGKGLPGERQLIVPSTDINSAKSTKQIATSKQPSNFQQWMNFLFGGNQKRQNLPN